VSRGGFGASSEPVVPGLTASLGFLARRDRCSSRFRCAGGAGAGRLGGASHGVGVKVVGEDRPGAPRAAAGGAFETAAAHAVVALEVTDAAFGAGAVAVQSSAGLAPIRTSKYHEVWTVAEQADQPSPQLDPRRRCDCRRDLTSALVDPLWGFATRRALLEGTKKQEERVVDCHREPRGWLVRVLCLWWVGFGRPRVAW